MLKGTLVVILVAEAVTFVNNQTSEVIYSMMQLDFLILSINLSTAIQNLAFIVFGLKISLTPVKSMLA